MFLFTVIAALLSGQAAGLAVRMHYIYYTPTVTVTVTATPVNVMHQGFVVVTQTVTV